MNIVDEHGSTPFSDRIWTTFLETAPAGFNARAAAFLERLLDGASLLWDETAQRSDRADKLSAAILLALHLLEKAEPASVPGMIAPEVVFLVHDTLSAKDVRGRYSELAQKLGMAPAGMLLADGYTPGIPDAADTIGERAPHPAPDCLAATPEALHQAVEVDKSADLSRLKLLVFVDVDVITQYGRSFRLSRILPNPAPQCVFLTEHPSEAVDAFVHDAAPQAARVVFAKRVDESVRDPRLLERVVLVNNWTQRLSVLSTLLLHPALQGRRWLFLCRPERVRDWRPKLADLADGLQIGLVGLWKSGWGNAELQSIEGLRTGDSSVLAATFDCLSDLELAVPDVDGLVFLDWPEQPTDYPRAERLVSNAARGPAIALVLLRLLYVKEAAKAAQTFGRDWRYANPFSVAVRIDPSELINGEKGAPLDDGAFERIVLRLHDVESVEAYEDEADVASIEQREALEVGEAASGAAAEFGDEEASAAELQTAEEAAPVRRTLTIRAGYVPSRTKTHVPQIEINEPLSSNTVELRAAQARERRAAGKTGGPLTHQLADKHGRIRRMREDNRRRSAETVDDGDSILGGLRKAEKKNAKPHGRDPQHKNERFSKKERRSRNNPAERKDFKRRQKAERAEAEEVLDEVLGAGASTREAAEAMQIESERGSRLRTPRSQRLKKLRAQKKEKRAQQRRDELPAAAAEAAQTSESANALKPAVSAAPDEGAKKPFKKKRFKPRFPKKIDQSAPLVDGAKTENVLSALPMSVESAVQAEPAVQDRGHGKSRRQHQKRRFEKMPREADERGQKSVDDDNFGNSIHYKPKGGASSVMGMSGYAGITGAGAAPMSSGQFLTSSLYGGRSSGSSSLTLPQSMAGDRPQGLTGAARAGFPGKKGKKSFSGPGKPFKHYHSKNKKNGSRGA